MLGHFSVESVDNELYIYIYIYIYIYMYLPRSLCSPLNVYITLIVKNIYNILYDIYNQGFKLSTPSLLYSNIIVYDIAIQPYM